MVLELKYKQDLEMRNVEVVASQIRQTQGRRGVRVKAGKFRNNPVHISKYMALSLRLPEKKSLKTCHKIQRRADLEQDLITCAQALTNTLAP